MARLQRHLLAINAIAVVLDLMFLVVSAWTFIEIASAMVVQVAWYYLALSFVLPICLPLYNAIERLVRRDCVRHAVRENAALHAYGRVRHAWMAAFWNSFGASTLIFWAPFFVDAVDAPAHLAPNVVWQRLFEIPSTLAFGVVYLLTVLWNLLMQQIYMNIAYRALRVLVDEEDDDGDNRRHATSTELNEIREMGNELYSVGVVTAPVS